MSNKNVRELSKCYWTINDDKILDLLITNLDGMPVPALMKALHMTSQGVRNRLLWLQYLGYLVTSLSGETPALCERYELARKNIPIWKIDPAWYL